MATALSDVRRTRASASPVAVQVIAKTPAARNAVTLTLALPGTRRSPGPYRAGQFITLTIPTTSGASLYRSYSLCGDGRTDGPWQITVKRVSGGKVSNYLIDRIQPGMVLQSSQPQGNFTMTQRPHPAVPFIFVTGGSGITPIYAILRAIAQLSPAERPRATLHYAYHGMDDAIFGRELLALDPQRTWLTQYHYVTTQGYRLNAARIVAEMGAQAALAHWYVCGPAAIRQELEAAATRHGVPATHLHAEVFASPAPRQHDRMARSGRAARIRLADSGVVLHAQPGETLLETLERGGYRPDFSCRAGACATCRLKVLAGTVHASDENNALTPVERARGYVLSCVAQPEGDITLATAGQQVAPAQTISAGGKARPPAARIAARRALRMSIAAAAVGIFASVWGLTHTSATTASSVTTGGSSSSGTSGSSNSLNSSNSPSNTGSGSSVNNGSSSPSNAGSIFTLPGTGGSNSSTGTS